MEFLEAYEFIPNIITIFVLISLIVLSRCFTSPLNEHKKYADIKESLIGSENFHSIKKYINSSNKLVNDEDIFKWKLKISLNIFYSWFLTNEKTPPVKRF